MSIPTQILKSLIRLADAMYFDEFTETLAEELRRQAQTHKDNTGYFRDSADEGAVMAAAAFARSRNTSRLRHTNLSEAHALAMIEQDPRVNACAEQETLFDAIESSSHMADLIRLLNDFFVQSERQFGQEETEMLFSLRSSIKKWAEKFPRDLYAETTPLSDEQAAWLRRIEVAQKNKFTPPTTEHSDTEKSINDTVNETNVIPFPKK